MSDKPSAIELAILKSLHTIEDLLVEMIKNTKPIEVTIKHESMR